METYKITHLSLNWSMTAVINRTMFDPALKKLIASDAPEGVVWSGENHLETFLCKLAEVALQASAHVDADEFVRKVSDMDGAHDVFYPEVMSITFDKYPIAPCDFVLTQVVE